MIRFIDVFGVAIPIHENKKSTVQNVAYERAAKKDLQIAVFERAEIFLAQNELSPVFQNIKAA